jgi:hypothetical protein
MTTFNYTARLDELAINRGESLDIIIGGGKYGCHAIEYLKQKKHGFIVVDVDANCLAVNNYQLKVLPSKPSSNGEYFVHGNLPQALELIDRFAPELIFPTAPTHIAADMAEIKFKLAPWREAKDSMLTRLPQSVVLYARNGKIIVSYNRDHECLEHCSMPQTCPTSQTTKPCTMTKLMKYASPEAFILVSHSITPGMGALKGEELTEFLTWAKTKERFIVGTACDCHGVFSAFKKTE